MSNEKSEETSSSSAFHPRLVRKLVTMHLEGDAELPALPTLTGEAAELVGELLRKFVLEARNRAAIQAEVEQEVSADGDSDTIEIRSEHISKISAEMLMDYS